MKKLLLTLVIIVAVLLLVVFIGGQFFVGSAVKAGVNNFGPRLTQTKVHLDDAKISPFSGHGMLDGLTIGNPAGWSDRNAFELGRVAIDLEPSTVLGDHVIVINDITIDQPKIAYETKIVSSNIGDLLKNIESAVGGGKETEPTAGEKPPRKLIVKRFTLRNAQVSVGLGSNDVTVPMPAIELTDLGVKEGGLTPAALSFAVMREITKNVVAAAAQSVRENGAEGAVKKAGDALKDLLGGKK